MNLTNVAEIVVILLFSITWHELAHALTAQYLGDDTPRRMGHISLNPFRHMDQYGIVLLFLSAFVGFGFAYGFTPVNERNMRPNPKTGGGIVAAVGPISNLILAALLAIPLRFSLIDVTSGAALPEFILRALELNVFLAIFNILPLPPLDGWRVLATFLSPRTLYDFRNFVQYGPVILLGLLLFEQYIHFFSFLHTAFVTPIVQFLLGINY